MDDSCAVCAETLEWAAYGPCGHREVCSTCVIRLRFVCEDRRCCLCKSESNIIFITKALGDYTRVINDFSVFPANAKEGRVGPYWYHEGTQAYFDDLDQYKMIKAMCRLSCSVCDNKVDEQRNEGPKKRGEFKNIEQLNSHLFHRHRLFMCSLCLEGRKIFICEHKLYNRSELDQHIKTGDSEVDGSESERGGFSGHPLCEFCRDPFYGENELYLHMSTEHFTCHICQRQHPGQYEYYRNYDDLENHFRQRHFLCEDEACLAKKFIVFTTESEMKRHYAMEHGGNMSRSKRNATLQIPTSFQYRRNNEQSHRGRGRNFHPDSPNNQLSVAIQSSLETANAARSHVTSSPEEALSNHRERIAIGSIVNPFELLATTDSETSVRNRQSLGQNSGNGPLTESSFPPLPIASRSSRRNSRLDSRLGGNTMAARLRNQNTITVYNFSQARSAVTRPTSSASRSSKSRPPSTSGLVSSSASPSPSRNNSVFIGELEASSYAAPTPARSATANGLISANLISSSRNSSSTSKVSQSTSASNLGDTGSSFSSIPLISATQTNRLPTSNQLLLKAEDVQAANKSLIEKIRAALEFDEEKCSAFKEISTKYRKGITDAGEYLASVHQFGLSHLILELARLCPDAEKQKELFETYNYNMRGGSYGNSSGIDSGQLKNKKGLGKGKEKCEGSGISIKDNMAEDSKRSSVRKLQSDSKHFQEEAAVSSKDEYKSPKGKSKLLVGDEQTDLNFAICLQREPSSQNDSRAAVGGSKQTLVTGGSGNKQRKKVSKFLRSRLGDSSSSAVSDIASSDSAPVLTEEKRNVNKDKYDALPVHGVWRNGGGRKLVAMTQRGPPK